MTIQILENDVLFFHFLLILFFFAKISLVCDREILVKVVDPSTIRAMIFSQISSVQLENKFFLKASIFAIKIFCFSVLRNLYGASRKNQTH